MSGHNTGTDRVDFEYIAECSGECDIEMSASGKHSKHNVAELFPTEECPICGEDWNYISQEEDSTVFEE